MLETMFAAGGTAFAELLQPQRIGWMLVGVTVGLVIGVLPGLGGTVGMSILLPFIFGMDATTGIALLIGMASVIHTSDTFPSVLIGVPGSSGSQATIMDGYPMAKKGEGGRALGAAFLSSAIGGVIGAVILFSVILVARPIVLALGNPELFMFGLLGLSMVAVLSKGSALAGLLSAITGLLIGLIGIAPNAAQFRYTFDSLYLFDGIPLAVLALGLFAIPEMIDLVILNRAVADEGLSATGGRMQGVKDVLRNKMLVLRSAVLGTVVGFIPGLGGSVVDWIAYGVTKRTTKDNEEFGKGDVRGVIGPESANNAKEGGAMIPTLLFGIPGSGTTAILLGGLILLGIQPGPSMLTTDLDVTVTIIWTIALANVFGALACFLATGQVSKIAFIPAKKMVPFLFVVILMAAYQSTRYWGDFIALMVVGTIAWFMKSAGWPRVPMLIGIVLAKGIERYLHISIQLHGFEWLRYPGVLILGALIVFIVFGSEVRDLTRSFRMGRRTSTESVSD